MRAFTLIEILVVVTILAIAATIAIPSVGNGYDNIRVPSAARMVMSDILYAQNIAVTTQNPTFLIFLGSNEGYTVVSFDPLPSSTPSLPSLSDVRSGTLSITGAKYVTQPTTQSRYIVEFGPDGGENAAGPLARTQISSLSLPNPPSGSSKAFGFDSLGQPIFLNGDLVMGDIELELAAVRDANIKQKLLISPITGEINVPK